MQWSTEPHGGFTAPTPCCPVISDGPYGYEHVNVADQRRDPDSLLNWTERIIRMRKEVPEIGWGDFEVLAGGDRRCWRCATTGATIGAVRAQLRREARARSRYVRVR